MVRFLAAATWPEVQAKTLVLLPLGSVEQHGPHLPLDTDAVTAGAVADRTAALLEQEHPGLRVTVAPTMLYGASGEHQGFPGTCSIGTEVLRLVIVELVRSIDTWAGRVLFVNGHGGNLDALRGAVAQLRHERYDVAWVPCATEDADAHAGFTETSLMLHLRPDRVRLDRAEAGNSRPLEQLMGELVRGGVAAVSANGVLGDPSGACAAEGERVLETMATGIARQVVEWRPDMAGRLRTSADTPA